jgi:dTDP-4-dehydrorhamnose 3,5-epimerase
MDQPRKDRQTVRADGTTVAPRIDGVCVRPAVTIEDERGSICEIYNPAWGVDDAPVVYAYQTTIRPHRIKGWVRHHAQDDRLFFAFGSVKVVLYDDRVDSPTYGMINELFFSEHNRGLLIIPRRVWHAIENIGQTDVVFTNLPTQPYNHADPDKYRLPLDTDAIPYRFADRRTG